MFEEPTNDTYEVLQEDLQQYCYVYTAAFKKVVEVHHESGAEDLTKSVYIKFKNSPYSTTRDVNHDIFYNDRQASK